MISRNETDEIYKITKIRSPITILDFNDIFLINDLDDIYHHMKKHHGILCGSTMESGKINVSESNINTPKSRNNNQVKSMQTKRNRVQNLLNKSDKAIAEGHSDLPDGEVIIINFGGQIHIEPERIVLS